MLFSSLILSKLLLRGSFSLAVLTLMVASLSLAPAWWARLPPPAPAPPVPPALVRPPPVAGPAAVDDWFPFMKTPAFWLLACKKASYFLLSLASISSVVKALSWS